MTPASAAGSASGMSCYRNIGCCVTVTGMERKQPQTPQTLRDLLTERNIRMDAAATLAGVSASTISRICNGTEKARPKTVVALAQALGVSARRMQSLCDAARQELTP